MAPPLDRQLLERRLIAELARVRQASAPELQQYLGISQASFSRLASSMGERLFVTGNGRARRYAARRSIEGVGDRVPLYEVNERARARRVAVLHALLPQAFFVEATSEDFTSALHADLPYFLNDLRPSGFLGRIVPFQHPELEAPRDVRLWSGTHALRYLSRFGWNLSGDLIAGDDAFARYLAHASDPPDLVLSRHRARRYPELAEGVLSAVPGSSAGGEQPKFLVTRAPGPTALIVKFSPPTKDAAARRPADLLVCEHLAHAVLRHHGRQAARSSLLTAGGRTFLEVERFDRTSSGGRRGLLSLLALDAEFAGRLRTWSDSVAELVRLQIVKASVLEEVKWLELFGHLIGNSDMHGGNLSFFSRGSRVLALAPAYDMLPASYAGQAGNIVERALDLGPPSPAHAGVWDAASRAALDFWRRVKANRSISAGFRRIAGANVEKVIAFRRACERLPGG